MKKILSVLFILLLAGCAGRNQVVVKKEAAEPDLDAIIARESKGLSLKKAMGELDLLLFSSSPATTKVTSETKPLQYEVSIPVGASIDAYCYLGEEANFPGVVLKNIFDSIGALPNIEKHKVREIKSGVMNNIPYIYLEAEYKTKDNQYGIAKLIASSTMEVSFYCSHDEPGYRQTFFDVVQSLAKSEYIQGFARELSHYRKKQIDIMHLNEMSLGYSVHYQLDLEGNEKRDVSFSSALIPRSASAISTNDSIDFTTYSGKTGRLLEGDYYSYTNNEPDYELEIAEGEKGKYTVKGIFQGKEVAESFSPQKNLIYSGHIVDLYIENKTRKKEWEFEEYVPLSPVSPTTSTIKLLEGNKRDKKIVEYSFAGAKATVKLDARSYSEMDMTFGNATFKMVREYLDLK